MKTDSRKAISTSVNRRPPYLDAIKILVYPLTKLAPYCCNRVLADWPSLLWYPICLWPRWPWPWDPGVVDGDRSGGQAPVVRVSLKIRIGKQGWRGKVENEVFGRRGGVRRDGNVDPFPGDLMARAEECFHWNVRGKRHINKQLRARNTEKLKALTL